MNSITTDWLTPEMVMKYKVAIPHVNITELCKKHDVPRQYVGRVLDGSMKKYTIVAKVALVLDEAVCEYEKAVAILNAMSQKQTA